MNDLTDEERRAVATLQRLAKRWPKSLWLFSGAGTLCVMKFDKDGNRVTLDHGGMDPESSVATIKIPNDGGDW